MAKGNLTTSQLLPLLPKTLNDGSAYVCSVQVHKAHLRPVLSSDKYSNVMAKANKFQEYKVVQNEDIWCICNKNGLSLEQIQAANPGMINVGISALC